MIRACMRAVYYSQHNGARDATSQKGAQTGTRFPNGLWIERPINQNAQRAHLTASAAMLPVQSLLCRLLLCCYRYRPRRCTRHRRTQPVAIVAMTPLQTAAQTGLTVPPTADRPAPPTAAQTLLARAVAAATTMLAAMAKTAWTDDCRCSARPRSLGHIPRRPRNRRRLW